MKEYFLTLNILLQVIANLSKLVESYV